MGKKNIIQITNNIQGQKVEIDYDKLADAIVQANKRLSSEKNVQTDKQERPKFWRSILDILKGHSSKDGHMSAQPSIILVSLFYRFIAIVIFIFLIAMVIGTALYLFDTSWYKLEILKNILLILCVFSCLIGFFSFAVILLGAANDIERETDKAYIASVSSSVFGFLAFAVSAIMLVLQNIS